MDIEKKLLEPENLPLSLGEFGSVIEAQIVIPGVYEVMIKREEMAFAMEAFIVLRDASEISETAKQYGQVITAHPGLLLYMENSEGNPCCIIDYELFRHKILNKLPLPETRSIREIAIFGAELYPDYFGNYLVPILTPWGRTIRHKVIANGLYWLETEHCQRGLAVAYPRYDNLSDGAKTLAVEFDDRLSLPGEQEPGNLFFVEVDSCVPLFEFISGIHKEKLNCQIKPVELMNAIYQNHPEYVALYNLTEQSGGNDSFTLLMSLLGVKMEPCTSIDRMIKLSPNAGTDFIPF